MKNNIKKIREEQGLTQMQLANKIGISVGYLCHLENGSRDNPSIMVMKNISKALNKTIEEIFDFNS